MSVATTDPPHQRHVERVMGTVVSFDVREAATDREAAAGIAAAVDWLHEVDRRFSPYRPESEVSRLADGTLATADASDEVRAILAMCEALRVDSGGVFDARGAGPDGRLDPSGLVKGWAVQRAAELLAAHGCRAFAIDAGGDVVVAGGDRLPAPWRVGIRHPDRADRVAAVVSLADGAVATSGTYERGAHLRRPAAVTPVRDGDQARSMTVIGPDLVWADAYATAAFLMGRPGLGWVADHDGYDAIAVIGDRLVRTPGSDRYLADPA
jgi:FAD:protein FMN transferase